MRTILVIGIGAGNPDYLTLQAIKDGDRGGASATPDIKERD